MKEEDLEKAAILRIRKRVIEAVKNEIGQRGDPIYNARHRFIRFLDGEIQALNLELHNLGVELPGVPQIGEKQAVTKGNDI